MQPMLFAAPKPPDLRSRGIDLRCCAAEDVEWPEADLVIADPPWTYSQKYGASAPPYACMSTVQIANFLGTMRAPRLALWMAWPILPEWVEATREAAWPWRWVSGGAWTKSNGEEGHYGPGHHWAGCSEPVLLYTRGKSVNTHALCRNAWGTVETNSTPNAPAKMHSYKPVGWMVQWLRRWTLPGARILDPFAGLGSVAEAVLLAGEGRTYVGAEIDPERHAAASALLAQVRG